MTSDVNERVLGSQQAKSDSRNRYKTNKTGLYIRVLKLAQRTYIQGRARKLDVVKLETQAKDSCGGI